MIKDYREITSKFAKDFNEVIFFSRAPQMEKYRKLDNILNMCIRVLIELADNYEELEADNDELNRELLNAREENRTLKTCYMQHIETITEQRNKINELEYIIRDLNELGEFINEQ